MTEITIDEVKWLLGSYKDVDDYASTAAFQEASQRMAALCIRQEEELERVHQENRRMLVEKQALRDALVKLTVDQIKSDESLVNCINLAQGGEDTYTRELEQLRAQNELLQQKQVPNSVLEQLIICAFRYALERRTVVLREMLEYIEPLWERINPTFQRQIKDDLLRKAQQLDKDDLTMVQEILRK